MFVEIIFNFLNTQKKSVFNKLALKIFKIFHIFFKKTLIKYKVLNQEIFFPISHGTLYTWMRSEHYSMNLGRVCKIYKNKYKNNPIIDIGAKYWR